MQSNNGTPKQSNQSHDTNVHHIRLAEYEITDEPVREKWYTRLPLAVQDRIEELHSQIRQGDEDSIRELENLIIKYPKVPLFYNYLSAAYQYANMKEKAEETIIENYRKNPDYLFAKLNYAEIFLRKGDYAEFAEIFRHNFDIKFHLPNRRRFHLTEFTQFYASVGRYYAGIKDYKTAQMIYDMLCNFKTNSPNIQSLGQMLETSLLRRVATKFTIRR